MKNIIITGGLGHIGSYLIKKVLRNIKNSNLIIIDNVSSQKLFSLFSLKTNKNKISFYDIDLTRGKISKIVGKADIIIHLAAKTDAEKSVGNEKLYLKNNLLSTKKVVQYAKKYKVPLIFPSSTSVYGKMKDNDTLEEYQTNKLFPQSPYAKIKLKEEKIIKANLKSGKYAIIRLGTIVGVSSGMRFHTAVNKFCYQASLNKEITIWKSAYEQVRPYATVDDFCKVIIYFIKNLNKVENDIFNLVSKNLSVKQIINFIREKKKVRIKFVKSKIMNQLSYNVSNEKIKKLGFKPSNQIRKEIFKTLKLFNFENKKN